MDELTKLKLNEIGSLLEELEVKGSQNVMILGNVFARLRSLLEEANKGAVIDNTKKEAK